MHAFARFCGKARLGAAATGAVILERNTRLQPFSPYGWCQLAMTLQQLGRADDARRIQRDLRRFEPRFVAALARDLAAAGPHS